MMNKEGGPSRPNWPPTEEGIKKHPGHAELQEKQARIQMKTELLPDPESREEIRDRLRELLTEEQRTQLRELSASGELTIEKEKDILVAMGAAGPEEMDRVYGHATCLHAIEGRYPSDQEDLIWTIQELLAQGKALNTPELRRLLGLAKRHYGDSGLFMKIRGRLDRATTTLKEPGAIDNTLAQRSIELGFIALRQTVNKLDQESLELDDEEKEAVTATLNEMEAAYLGEEEAHEALEVPQGTLSEVLA